jgi:hypothetical protein
MFFVVVVNQRRLGPEEKLVSADAIELLDMVSLAWGSLGKNPVRYFLQSNKLIDRLLLLHEGGCPLFLMVIKGKGVRILPDIV